MVNNPLSIESAVELLNGMLEADRDAITVLITKRVLCNENLANHPTVQVHDYDNGTPSVGLLGILNGIFGIYDEGKCKGSGPIAVVVEEDGTVLRFIQVLNLPDIIQ
jgi:hypothetical protein